MKDSPHPGDSLTIALRERLAAIADDVKFPVRLSVDETEETIRILWEFVGHMGDDVGVDGYEFRLLERARHWAQSLQAAILAAVAHAGPRLVAELVEPPVTNGERNESRAP